jgi:hypothetical protein
MIFEGKVICMSSVEDFPFRVQEVLNFMLTKKFLSAPFQCNNRKIEVFKNFNTAMDMYLDQDIKKPYYFLPDITEDAKSNYHIPPPPNRLREFALHRDEMNYFNRMIKNNSHLDKIPGIDDDDLESLIGSFYEDLIACAKARLFSEMPISYFEDIFDVYKNNGWPFCWKSSKGKKHGNFVVFSI